VQILGTKRNRHGGKKGSPEGYQTMENGVDEREVLNGGEILGRNFPLGKIDHQ
jgi:hypothetical protein